MKPRHAIALQADPPRSLTRRDQVLMSIRSDQQMMNGTVLRAMRVFRALRILRAFKLGSVWEPLSSTLSTMYQAAAPIASLAVLVLLFILMFSLLGKELFGGSGLNQTTRWHYDGPGARWVRWVSNTLSLIFVHRVTGLLHLTQASSTSLRPHLASLCATS